MSFFQKIFSRLRFNRKNWKAVTLSVFAAAIFWIFNALNKNYTANIDFPVEIRYDQDRFIPVRGLPEEVRINVEGNGWDLFRKSAGLKVKSLVINLDRPVEVKKIVGHTLPALFTTQLDEIKINFVLTDTLYIDIDYRAKRKFILTVDSVVNFIHPAYTLKNEVSVNPDTVWIEGPKHLVEALPDTLSLPLTAQSISRNYVATISINPGNSRMTSTPTEAKVAFEVEPIIERKDSVKLILVNVPSRFKRTQSVQQVVCTFQLPKSLDDSFSPDSVYAELDLSEIKKGSYIMMPKVKSLPSRVRVIALDSVRLNF